MICFLAELHAFIHFLKLYLLYLLYPLVVSTVLNRKLAVAMLCDSHSVAQQWGIPWVSAWIKGFTALLLCEWRRHTSSNMADAPACCSHPAVNLKADSLIRWWRQQLCRRCGEAHNEFELLWLMNWWATLTGTWTCWNLALVSGAHMLRAM